MELSESQKRALSLVETRVQKERRKDSSTPNKVGRVHKRRHGVRKGDSSSLKEPSKVFDKRELARLIERLTENPGDDFVAQNANTGLLLDANTSVSGLGAKRTKRSQRREAGLRANIISRKKRKALLQTVIDKVTYKKVLPLKKLWLEYAEPLFCKLEHHETLQPSTNMRKAVESCKVSLRHSRLLKQLEFHGCEISAKTNESTKVGIIFRNGKNAFHLVTKDSDVKIVPKRGTLFQLHIASRTVRFRGETIIS